MILRSKMYLSESKIALYADILYPQLCKAATKQQVARVLSSVDKEMAGKVDLDDCLDIAGKILYCL